MLIGIADSSVRSKAVETRHGFEKFVSELLDRCRTPGVALGLLDCEHTILTAGTRGDGRGPIERDTIFAAASLTKPVFTAGVMVLIEEGVLELDRPLEYLQSPYLPSDQRSASIWLGWC